MFQSSLLKKISVEPFDFYSSLRYNGRHLEIVIQVCWNVYQFYSWIFCTYIPNSLNIRCAQGTWWPNWKMNFSNLSWFCMKNTLKLHKDVFLLGKCQAQPTEFYFWLIHTGRESTPERRIGGLFEWRRGFSSFIIIITCTFFPSSTPMCCAITKWSSSRTSAARTNYSHRSTCSTTTSYPSFTVTSSDEPLLTSITNIFRH